MTTESEPERAAAPPAAGATDATTTTNAAPSGAEAAATFAIEGEDHTLANALRFHLNKNPHVAFCGYSIPHPSEAVVNLRIQTTGEISAAQALRQAAADLKAASATLRETFSRALETGEGGAPIAGAPPKVVLAAASKAR